MSLVCSSVVAFALAWGGLAYAASGNAPAKHPDVKQAENTASAYPAMWKLVNGKSTVYFLGSVHVLPVNLSWRAPAIDQAIEAADIFVFEANLDFSTAEFHYFMDNSGYLPRGQTLHAMLSPDARKQYLTLIRDMHLDPNRVDYLRPGLASLILESAYSATHTSLKLGPGVDAALVRYAKNHSKELRYLESLQSQFEVLAKLGGGSEIKALEKTLAEMGKDDGAPQVLFAAWAKGDLPKLASIANEDPSQRAVLLDGRNNAWLPKIESMLKDPKTYLVTVGAAHLAGPKSVIGLLCAKGWKVERVQTGPTPPPPACGT
jgi:uncharacterized protein YbaP (TraB family)